MLSIGDHKNTFVHQYYYIPYAGDNLCGEGHIMHDLVSIRDNYVSYD